MPHINIWIRKDDMPAWDAIRNKPEWLHTHLDGAKLLFDKAKKPRPIVEKQLSKVIKKIRQEVPREALCKIHGTPLDSRDRCLQKDCKYA